MFKRLLRALLLCAGLFALAPDPAPAAPFAAAAAVPRALDAPLIAVRGGAHWRHFWRVYRARQRMRRHRLYRHRHVRRWHHHRPAMRPRGRARFGPGRAAAPPASAAPMPPSSEPALPKPASPKASPPKLY